MNKKNTLKGVLIGGLLLSAPFATFATNGFDDMSVDDSMGQGKDFRHSQGTLLDEPYVDENYIERLDSQIEQKIENAKYLIGQLAENDSSVDVDRLNEIVDEFAQLDSELDALDIEDALADELREVFFETRDEAKDLTTEFRGIIADAFSDEEKVELRAELQQRSYADNMINQRDLHMPIEVIKIIDSDIADQLENGEITMYEAHTQIKEIMENMSEDELQELKEEIQDTIPENMGPEGMDHPGMGRGGPHGPDEITQE